MTDLENSVDKMLCDVDFVASDTHFGHENIIKYCRNSDFKVSEDGLQQMTRTITENWNSRVSDHDTVLFLGDLAWLYDQTPENIEEVDDLYAVLNGDIKTLRGDHDMVKPSHIDQWDYTAVVRHDGRDYLAAHFPGDTPEELPGSGMSEDFKEAYGSVFEDHDGIILHGHHHNNHLEQYPFFNPDRGTVNCSVELLDGYRPVSMEKIGSYVGEGRRVETLGD